MTPPFALSRWLVAGAVLLASACGPAPLQHGDAARLGAAPLAPCPPLPTGAEPLVELGSTVVIGEIHGTQEVPKFVGTLACDAAQRTSVIVGLEVASDLTPALRRYIASDGTRVDRELLLTDKFWAAQDGRASEAMLLLLDDLRELRLRGKIVDVFGFDGPGASDEENARDRAMAANIVRALAAEPDPNRVALILTGNLHAQVDTDRWMAWHVRAAVPGLISLNVAFRGGSAWVCTPECGPRELPGRPSEGSRHFVELASLEGGKWDGRFYLDRATASLPLRSAEPVADNGASDPASARDRANAAYQTRDYTTCAGLFAEAAGGAAGRQAASDHYNAACCSALAGDADSAFAALDAAISSGLRDMQNVKVDGDLKTLHTDPRWQGVLAGVRTNEDEFVANNNAELIRIFRADQADRQGPYDSIDWSKVTPRDERRRARIREILAAGGVRTSADYYHAAMVFQHSEAPADYQKAHELAVKAAELDPDNGDARWLAAAAEDRYLMSQGKPQKYGTQFKKVNGVWQLWTVDPSVSDDERARWNVPPLAVAKQRVDAMNR